MRRMHLPGASALAISLSLALPVAASAQQLTLGEALDHALSTHPTLAAATARVGAAEESADAARASRLPALAVTGLLMRHEQPMVVAPLHSFSPGNPPQFDRTLAQGRLGARYTLFDGGGTGSRIRGADAAYERSRTARSTAQARVLEETIGAYLAVSIGQAMLEAASAQVAALREERSRAQRHFDAGSAAQVEVLRAEAVLQEALAEEAGALARVGVAERALARLMGVDPALVAGRDVAAINALPAPARGDARNSPLVLGAEQTIAVAEARLSEERAGRLPTVDAGAALLDYGTWSGHHVLEWQAGLEVSWPVFTGGARSASLRRAAADVEAARSDLAATRLEVEQQIDAALASILDADARIHALSAAVAQWEEVARIEALALESGAGEQRDLMRAEAGLFQARAGLAAARRDAVMARVTLARAEGVLDMTWINDSLETR